MSVVEEIAASHGIPLPDMKSIHELRTLLDLQTTDANNLRNLKNDLERKIDNVAGYLRDCLDSFLEMVYNWKLEYGPDSINFSLNILRFPSFQSPLILPDNIRTQYKNQLAQFMVNHKGDSTFHEYEWNQLQRLVDYLDVVKTPHVGAAEQSVLQQDFKQFYTQYDQRRGKNFTETFPALADWYNTL
jgi:hypothetical protein